MHKDPDLALLEDCRGGDRRALDSLVRRYERPVYNAAFRMLGTRDEAADVTQTVFLKAFENLDRFNPQYRFFSWLYRIAINESIDQLKRRRRVEPLVGDGVSAERGPEAATEAGRMHDALQAALMALDEDHRAVIVLRHFTGYSYRQIGEILEIPDRTVKSRLYSARQKMRANLENRGIFSP
jgi:RNA polymerase sigma-70 factor (ECF subfamily)